MPKIVLVHDRFPPDYAGGGEYVVLMLAKYLQKKGCEVKVIATGDPAQRSFDGIATHRLNCSPYRLNFKWKQLAELCQGADLIQTFTYHGLLPAYAAGKKLKIPTVATVLAQFGDNWLEMRGALLGRFYRWYERFLLNLPVARRIYLSEFSYHLARGISADDIDALVIEPGISLELYKPSVDKNYVLFSGKLESRKGVKYIIKAAAQLPHIPFRIIGWGDFDSWRKVSLPANLQLRPYVDRADLARRMGRARIFVFPTRVETFGLAVVEAMASGCAIVSSSELEFHGRKVTGDDLRQLAGAIDELWNNPVLCRQMGADNRRLAQQYNWDRHVDRLLQVYQSLLVPAAEKAYPAPR